MTSPAGSKQVTAQPGSALALAAGLDVPIRVADALMDRLAVPVTGDDLLGPFVSRIRPYWKTDKSGYPKWCPRFRRPRGGHAGDQALFSQTSHPSQARRNPLTAK